MTYSEATSRLENAELDLRNARAAFNAAKPGTKTWRDAEEVLCFWQGKTAFLAAAQQQARKDAKRYCDAE